MNFTWIITIMSVIGVVLNIKKKRACFYIWAITNASWAVIDFWQGLPAQGTLFVIYFVLALWGIREWRKDNVQRPNND